MESQWLRGYLLGTFSSVVYNIDIRYQLLPLKRAVAGCLAAWLGVG